MKTVDSKSSKVALAIGAHPDDIEFMMAGTLLMLGRAGWEIHCLNVADGCCGSRQFGASQLAAMRRKEARASARVLGAHWHPGFVKDLEILYELKTLRRLAAVLREIKPSIVLTHSPHDYMEDHTNTCRLAVTAAFSLGMPNFRTTPTRTAIEGDVTLYHALPHGLRDGLGRRVVPGSLVNITPVYKTKLEALARHESQQTWLDVSQGLNSYLKTMEEMACEIGRFSRRFTHAEGWCRHSHLGFSAENTDPLKEALGADYLANQRYEAGLEKGF
jgi:LmbE family N-acetylglucosaminyl deacetylase